MIKLQEFLSESQKWNNFLKELKLEDYPLEELPIFYYGKLDIYGHEKIMLAIALDMSLISNPSAFIFSRNFDELNDVKLSSQDWEKVLYSFIELHEDNNIEIEQDYQDLLYLSWNVRTCTWEQFLDLANRLRDWYDFIPNTNDIFKVEDPYYWQWWDIIHTWEKDHELKEIEFDIYLSSLSDWWSYESYLLSVFEELSPSPAFKVLLKSKGQSSIKDIEQKIEFIIEIVKTYRDLLLQTATNAYGKTKISENKWSNLLDGFFSSFLTTLNHPEISILPLIYTYGDSKHKEFLWWKGHAFRSSQEKKIAIELDKRKILFFPNAGCRIEKSTKEVDFLIFYKGNWGILECDSKTYHTEPEKDKERDKVFQQEGIQFIKRYSHKECFYETENTIDAFLKEMQIFFNSN